MRTNKISSQIFDIQFFRYSFFDCLTKAVK